MSHSCIPKTRRASARGVVLAAILAVAAIAAIPASANAYVYWANGGCCTSTPQRGTIGRANNDGTGVNQFFVNPPGNSTNLQGLSVNDTAGLYWIDAEYGTVGHSNIDGTAPNNFFIFDSRSTAGLATDSQHVFWTNRERGAIGRAALDGSGANLSFVVGGTGTRGLAVGSGYLYWINDITHMIGRATTAGASVQQNFIAIPTPLGGVTPDLLDAGVAVDGNYIYWTDSANDSIGRAKLDGTGVTDSFITGLTDPTGITVDSSHIYWSSFGPYNTVGVANLDGSNVNNSFITGGANPYGVAVDDLGVTGTSVDCSPGSVSAESATTCTATVANTDNATEGAPSGTVSFTSDGPGEFSGGGNCTLAPIDSDSASCSLSYTAAATPSSPARTDTIAASYLGDASHGTSSGTAGLTVSSLPPDTTPPSLSASHAADGQNGWNVSSPVTETVTASDGGSGLAGTPSCTVDGSAVSLASAGSGSWTFVISSDGSHAVSCSASDNAGNESEAEDTVKIDTAGPDIALSSPLGGASYILGSFQAASYSCSDGTSGLASCEGPVANGAGIDTSSVGSHTFDVSATDNAGNSNKASATYTVGYALSGFRSPIDNMPTVNTGKAGRTYPLKWQLQDASGHYLSSLSAVASITYRSASCGDFSGSTDGLETEATGGTSLRYDSTANQYVYNWATPGKGCYVLSVKLNSGQVLSAAFKLS